VFFVALLSSPAGLLTSCALAEELGPHVLIRTILSAILLINYLEG